MTESEYIARLEAENTKLVQEVKILGEKVAVLLKLLEKKGVKKDSHNSHLPPSSDIRAKKNQSLREPSGRKSGGQAGHSGSSLEMRAVADKIIELKSEYCGRCGSVLSGQEYVLQARRQVIELPPIAPRTEEYRQYACRCGNCEHLQVADFPRGVNAPIRYGNSVSAMIGYLSVYQYVPYYRLKKLLTDVFKLPLSEGSINNMLEKGASKAEFVYAAIKAEIGSSKVVGSDETGAAVNGEKWWLWVWQNALNTFLKASANRGSQTVEEVWGEGLPEAVLVSDRWAAQLKTESCGKQLCLAHLLREAIYLKESEKHEFSEKFEKFLRDIFKAKRKIAESGQAYLRENEAAQSLENGLNEMLGLSICQEKYGETAKFQRAMLKHRNSLLPCLYEVEIPADNNGSERAIRNVKVKQKISGQFKSGQQSFCVLRSVIDTLLKRQLDVLTYLTQIMNIQPE